jgi:D-alanyl-lipoteichoic acid acyltransferase DltB (MBOAT superfamily)
MVIKLMENFERPYFSKSVAEFWRRWHISLSTWLRDYVYYPLALSVKRPTRMKLYIVTLVTFLLSGLWHGAAWNYVVMGAWFGFCIILAEILKKYRLRLFTFLQVKIQSKVFLYCEILFTFSLVCIGWVFFRAEKLTDAFYIISHFSSGMSTFIAHSYSYYTWKNLFSLHGIVTKADFIIALLGIALFIFIDLVERTGSFWNCLSRFPVYVRWFVYYAFIVSIITFGRFGVQDFIYFQF